MAALPKSVIVTGAANGLGKAIATEFLKRGVHVALVDVAAAALQATVAELQTDGVSPDHVISIVANISDEEAAERIFSEAVAAFGQVDALVNCAGVLDAFQAVGEQDIALWRRVLDINLTGAFLLSRLAVQEFERTATAGTIVNISSAAATRGGMSGTAYTTSKWGLLGLTKSTAAAYASKGIRCNAICPGGMKTSMTPADNETFDPSRLGSLFSTVMKLSEVMPGNADIARLGRLVVFLTSEDGQDINGAVINVDKGWTAI